MDYYFNELSVTEMPSDKKAIYDLIEQFVKTCIATEKYGFKKLRTSIYFGAIPIVKGEYYLRTWIKDKNVADKEIQRKFKSLETRTPLIEDFDSQYSAYDYSIFKLDDKEVDGLGVAFLKNSLAISFATQKKWQSTEIEINHEGYDFLKDEIIFSKGTVKNICEYKQLETHREFILEQLKTQSTPENWNPKENYLPNVEISNKVLQIADFYKNIEQKSRSERTAEYNLKGKHIAELNHYAFNKEISNLNRTFDKFRFIYQSQNKTGKTIYLSIDFEKGAFEVCDDSGVHIEEILFDGRSNSGQQLNHSIKLKN